MSSNWQQLSSSGSIPPGRSSHLVVTKDPNEIFVFGGEKVPRHPIDDDIFRFDLKKKEWNKVEVKGKLPPKRVGHDGAAIGDVFYVFGGRLGVEQESTSMNDLWKFDLTTSTWSEIKFSDESVIPEKRSYHVATSSPESLFVFGGCGTSGRLNDLWQFSHENQTWKRLNGDGEVPSPRGGPALCYHQEKLYLFGGFDGKELGDLYIYDLPSNRWTRIEQKGDIPLPRSVCQWSPISSHQLFLFGGEADPSDLGHEGAGEYHGDSFLFDCTTSTWKKVHDHSADNVPVARGWYSGTSLGKQNFVLFGGFDGESRRDDLWIYTNNE